ncbi:MAG: DUF2267 domain-containing protein [Leptolyngbyaceae cyanobacterium SM1_1_3]|nr:DUF2267 domain-containing protein [Leptolyngbyaceae cyanobacterium SM1_1_3]NJN01064.1 DUF2267 domain-containing protein [Leptolyngbyaceae cyanobacterium RM1_1_2]NJO11869.1 DUF2267 domain-containing protein [Leptolyngbyaceae cyanobacterium SL_1_1]
MEAKPIQISPTTPPVKSSAFLMQVMEQGGLEDLYDARDVIEVVFRTVRDLMTTETAQRVAAEIESDAEAGDSQQIAALWRDTNPVVSVLSRLRPPLKFEDDTFLFRIAQESGLSKQVMPADVVKAVFQALKPRLSAALVQEVSLVLPGQIRRLWQSA